VEKGRLASVVRDGRRAEEDTLPASRKGGIRIGAQPCEWNAVLGAGCFGWEAERLPGRVETVGKSIAWMRGSVGEDHQGNERRNQKNNTRVSCSLRWQSSAFGHIGPSFGRHPDARLNFYHFMFSTLHNITQVGPRHNLAYTLHRGHCIGETSHFDFLFGCLTSFRHPACLFLPNDKLWAASAPISSSHLTF
jgi:hypothetical protein